LGLTCRRTGMLPRAGQAERFRCVAGHFKPDHHFGFEAVSWYWHFVDVVWLLLFIFVYWV